MKMRWIMLSLLALSVAASPCFAALDWSVQKRLQVGAAPVDVAVSLNDKWVFVLNDRGEVLVFSMDGSLKEKIPVGKQISQIKVGPRGDLLYLSNRKGKAVEIIEISFVQNINTLASPYKGPADAPVTMVVFSDFE